MVQKTRSVTFLIYNVPLSMTFAWWEKGYSKTSEKAIRREINRITWWDISIRLKKSNQSALYLEATTVVSTIQNIRKGVHESITVSNLWLTEKVLRLNVKTFYCKKLCFCFVLFFSLGPPLPHAKSGRVVMKWDQKCFSYTTLNSWKGPSGLGNAYYYFEVQVIGYCLGSPQRLPSSTRFHWMDAKRSTATVAQVQLHKGGGFNTEGFFVQQHLRKSENLLLRDRKEAVRDSNITSSTGGDHW